MGTLTLSFALVAYNRNAFLTQLLPSILAQSRLPDEMIIGDDCSTDRTAKIINDFAAHAPFRVRWYVNDKNQGYSRNLERAIGLCSGDVIVFCDDDDVCLPHKLRAIEQEFLRSDAIGLVVGNSTLADEHLNPLGLTLWDTARLSARKGKTVLQNPVYTLARHFFAAGHVMSFRASLKPYILPFPREFPPRIFCDVWMALVLASVAKVACLAQPFVVHRLHHDQIAGVQSLVSSSKRREIRAQGRRRIEEFVPLLEEVVARVSALPTGRTAKRNQRSLMRWVGHMKMQAQLPALRRRRLFPIVDALLAGRYHRYSRGFFTAARDLLLLE